MKIIFLMALLCLSGFSQEKTIIYHEPIVGMGIFSEVSMLEKEKEDYANHIAAYAGNTVREQQASATSLSDARRYIALALHLNPKNRKAVLLNFQLTKGTLPEPMESSYSAATLAGLLFTRGQALVKEKSANDVLLGRCLIQVAAEMDCKNEDAVYESELLRLDKKSVDWSKLTDVKVISNNKND